MTESFSLRLLSGKRSGETIAIPRGGLLIGRRAGNDLMLEDSSVSGRHALVRVEDDGVQVEDLGSTNGTRIAGKKIERGSVPAAGRFKLGNVELEVVAAAAARATSAAEPQPSAALDAKLEVELEGELSLEEPDFEPAQPAAPAAAKTSSAAPTPAPAAAPDLDAAPAEGVEELLSIDTSQLERASKRSLLPLLGLLALLAGGGTGAFMLLGGGGDEPGAARARSATAIEGNKLELDVASFESDGAGWSSDEAAPVTFDTALDFANTGANGFGLDPAPGQWARASSDWVRVNPGDDLAVEAQCFAIGATAARIGLEFGSSAEASATSTLVHWSPILAGDTSDGDVAFTTLRANARVPVGYDSARAVLLGGDPRGRAAASGAIEAEVLGTLAFDDVALLEGDALERPAIGDFELGVDAAQVLLSRSGRALASVRASARHFELEPSVTLAARAAESGTAFELSSSGNLANARLLIDPQPALLGDELAISVVDAHGPRLESATFEIEGATDLLLGSGLDFVRFAFAEPVMLRSTSSDGRVRIEAWSPNSALTAVSIQVDFQSAREQAAMLAADARRSLRDGNIGGASATWRKLLAEAPFDATLVAEAQADLNRLGGAGLAELEQIERRFERARFFALPSMYTEVVEAARDVAERYGAGNASAEDDAVLQAALDLAGRAEAALAQVSGPESSIREVQRAAVFEVLDRSGQNDLIQRLRASAGELDGGGR